ncbi:MAG: hypothetical protein WHV44_06780 [Anaerolineales bacterium]
MNNHLPSLDHLENHLSRWEKWLYLCLGAAVIMLLHAVIKNYENTQLTGLFFALEAQGVDVWQAVPQYYRQFSMVYISVGRLILWLVVELAALVPAAILGLHSHWRRVALTRRLDLIGGFLLAGWVNLLALGAADPLNVGDGYNALVGLYLLALGGGYWLLKRRQERLEDVFP